MILKFKFLLKCLNCLDIKLHYIIKISIFSYVASPEDLFKLKMLEELKFHFWKLPPKNWFKLAIKYRNYKFILENAKDIYKSIIRVIKPNWKEDVLNYSPLISEFYINEVIKFLKEMNDEDILICITSEERSSFLYRQEMYTLKSKTFYSGYIRVLNCDYILKLKYIDKYCSTLENHEKYYSEVLEEIKCYSDDITNINNFKPKYTGILEYGDVEEIKKIINKINTKDMYILVLRGYEIYRHFATHEINKMFSSSIACSDLGSIMNFYVKNESNYEKDIKAAINSGYIENALFIQKYYDN